jgi:hypothetical protein
MEANDEHEYVLFFLPHPNKEEDIKIIKVPNYNRRDD